MENILKLFIWEGVLSDYTSGIMFALAENENDAREQILKKENTDTVKLYLLNKPIVITKSEGFLLHGGA